MKRLLILVLSIFVVSCGNLGPASALSPSQSCGAGLAQFQVFDGIIQRTCGCNEPGGVSFTTAQTFTCTVPAGTTVMFHFVSIQVQHQVDVRGAFTTPIMLPNSSTSIQTVPTPRLNSGTYPVFDLFVRPTPWGTITVL